MTDKNRTETSSLEIRLGTSQKWVNILLHRESVGRLFLMGTVSVHVELDCTTGDPLSQILKRISLRFQKTSGLPLLTQLHLFHHGLDVLNIVLLLFSRTPGFLQRPGWLVTHELHHHRSLLPQRSQTRLCTEERQADCVQITNLSLFLNI